MGILESIISTNKNGVTDSLDNVTNTNPFIQAMKPGVQTDLALFEQDKWGSILRRHKIVSGDGASIIDATLDYFLGDLSDDPTRIANMDAALKNLTGHSAAQNFIPIIIKTEHTYTDIPDKEAYGVNTNSDSIKKYPLYIIFDSTPESFSFQKSAQWDGRSILGRPEPVQVYNSSGATTINLQGDFFVSSIYEHRYKLKVSDFLMSLASPSKYNFMPSPITVTIGEWKRFRAIVNTVTIEYKGPWVVKDRLGFNQRSLNTPIEPGEIPAHSPYFFTATLSLTLVSPGNEVDFAEDVINGKTFNSTGYANSLTQEELNEVQNLLNYNKTLANSKSTVGVGLRETAYGTPEAGPFLVWSNPGSNYQFRNGVITQTANYDTVVVNPNFNSFEQSNLDRQRADLAMITHVINGQLSTFISNKLSNDKTFLGKLF